MCRINRMPQRLEMKTSGACRTANAAMCAAFLAIFATGSAAHGQTAFYAASAGELAGPPGTLIRQEPMSGAPLGAKTFRVLYRSTGLKGEPIAVSGAVIIPDGPAPTGGRPIVAWAHPTTGIVPHCAPTLALFFFQQIQGLREMVGRGYIVAATDYPGLGTAGPHPYLVGASEGRAVLDSVRAARILAGEGAGMRLALWGHSQGGQAVLYAGILAKGYAPELEVVGIAAAAPATELGVLMRDDFHTSGGKNLLAMTLWSWSRVFDAPITDVVDARAMPTLDRLAKLCIASIIDVWPRRDIGKELQKDFLTVGDLTAIEPWRTLLAENTVSTPPAGIPIFLAQGTADDTVDPPVTASYVKQACVAGSAVRFLALPGVGHGFAGRDSAAAAVEWMAARFAQAPAPSDCGPR